MSARAFGARMLLRTNRRRNYRHVFEQGFRRHQPRRRRAADRVRHVEQPGHQPHAIFKITGFAGSLAAFSKMGFEPPLYWVLLAILTESLCAIGLTLNLY